jgi:hypothetical protein
MTTRRLPWLRHFVRFRLGLGPGNVALCRCSRLRCDQTAVIAPWKQIPTVMFSLERIPEVALTAGAGRICGEECHPALKTAIFWVDKRGRRSFYEPWYSVAQRCSGGSRLGCLLATICRAG